MFTDSSLSRNNSPTDLNNDIDMVEGSHSLLASSKVVIPTSLLAKTRSMKLKKRSSKEGRCLQMKRARNEKENTSSLELYPGNNLNKRKKVQSHTRERALSNNSNELIDIYSYVTKADKQKIMMRVELPQMEEKLILSQPFESMRQDNWRFDITHEVIDKSQGGRLSIAITVQQCHASDRLTSDMDMIEFDIDLNVNVINHKSFSFLIVDLAYSSSHNEEVAIPQEVYSAYRKADNSNVIALIELSISKKHNSFFNKAHPSFSNTGIINEGATCYMNSMLQTLNAIGSFKKAVFQIPTEKDDYNSIALSLQRLFYDLMRNGSLASTKILLQSFGWTKEQIQIQHDVQEFNLLLSEVMEKKMKGTPCEGFYNKLFEGKLKNYIQCVNVDYKSERIEKFNEIQLTIKGNRNIYESFDAYTEEEILDNDDKYEADGYGKQKARKGIKFVSFPSVLTLLLKRFEYNSKKEMMVKINDYFEYDEEINLRKYLSKNSNGHGVTDGKEDDYIYTLHSVVVHQGNANSGHYYAYIKPTTKNFWILYNDDIVRPADSYELFNQNFGGNYQMYKHKGRGEIVVNNVFFERSAYILVYIKKSNEKSIMEPVIKEAIPFYLRKRFEKEKAEEMQELKKKKRLNENVNVLLFTNQNCFGHINKLGIINSFLDLDSDPPLIYNQSNRMLLNFPKHTTVEKFLQFISQTTEIPMSNMLLFEYNNADTFMVTSRHDFELLPFNEELLKTATLINYKTNNKKQYICFFLYTYGPYELFSFPSMSNDKEAPEEYTYGDNRLVYIPKHYNHFCFKKNMNTDMMLDQADITTALDSRIIFVKKYERKSNELRIVLIFHIKYDPNRDNHYHYNQIIDGINRLKGSDTSISNPIVFNSPYKYLIEKVSLCNWRNYSTFELPASNMNEIFIENNSLVIIPIEADQTYEGVSSFINDLNATFFIDIYTIYGIKLLKKIEIHLRPRMDEYYLKKIIIDQIKEKRLVSFMGRMKDRFYINNSREIIQVSEEFLLDSLTTENISLIDVSDGSQRQTLEVKDYPFLAYFNQTECKFSISFSLYKASQLSECFYQDFYLYDSGNNEIGLISSIIPKKMKKCAEILDYLFDPINSRFPWGFPKQNYYFFLQNQSREYLYQIITDGNKELKVYENKAKDIEYRLQPFEENERKKLDSNDYRKVFLTFAPYQKIKVDPMIIYLHKDETFFSIKNDISDLVMRNNKFNLIKTESEAIVIQINKAKMKDGKMTKDMREVLKDDDSLEYLFKDYSGVLNFLIEFVQ